MQSERPGRRLEQGERRTAVLFRAAGRGARPRRDSQMSYGVGCRVGSGVHRSRACRMTAWQRPGQVHRGSRRLRVGIWRAYGALLIIPAGDIDLRELRIEDEAEMIAQEEREREECALSEIIWRFADNGRFAESERIQPARGICAGASWQREPC